MPSESESQSKEDPLVAALHDAQDASEDRAAEVGEAVDAAVLDGIEQIQARTVEEMFEPLALLVENVLTDMTTAAVREGYETALKMYDDAESKGEDKGAAGGDDDIEGDDD